MRKFTTLFLMMLLCATVVFAQAPEKFTYQAVVRNANNSLVVNAQVGMRVSILQGSASGNAVYVETQTGITNTNGLLTVEIGGGNVQQGTFADIDWANGPFFLKTETDPNGGTNYSITSTQQMLSVPYALYAKDAGNGFSGDYNDLTNTPTIPTVPTNVSAFNNDAGYITGYTETDPQYNAWDKDYNDLINKPVIPVVPTNVSAFTNDAGYITMDSVPTVPANVSAFTNDAGYLTTFNETDPQFNAWDKDYNDLINKPTIPTVPENVSAFNNDVPYLTVEQQILSISNDTIFLTGGSFVKLPAGFSGDYNDLTNKPEIPTVPTNVSTFTNDANYVSNTACADVDLCAMAAALSQLQALVQEQQQRIEDLEAAIGTTDTTIIPVDTTNTFTNPTVSTDSATNVTETSATLNGIITNPDNMTITAQGFEWRTADGGTYTQVAANDTLMIYALTGLTANTSYIYKAFITYEGTTVYGEEVTFTTLAASTPVDGQPCSGASTVTDYDGNVYNTVQIGNQCWMRDNLRTTYYADGTAIPAGETNTDATLPYYYDYISSDIPLTQRGYLYNWSAVMRDASSSSANPSGVQGICPTGWHVPSDEEWTQLTNYVSAQNEYLCSDNAEFIAKVLASITGWSSSTSTCAVGNLQNLNNATGFNASPAGYLYNLGFTNSGKYAYFWTSTAASSTNAWYRSLNFNYAYVYRNNYGKHFGYSVRCLRDEGGSSTVQLPTVTTATMSDITSNSATSGGNVTSDGGATVTARGVCWSTTQNPTVTDDHTTDGSGTGSFTTNLTNLTPGTTYYVRAYATNSMGTAYGNEESFTTAAAALPRDGQPCVGAATVTDYEGHTYNTVQIGSQCWMAENLRTTHYSDGTAIPTGDGWSSTEPLYYTLEDSLEHGYLYNWRAVMHNSSSSQANPSGVQGVCPIGWHVPSDAEWTELETYVGSQSQYLCNNDSSYIAKALSATIGWSSCTNTCAVGNTPGSNNATGFSAMPAGYRDESSYSSIGENASFWSSTENSSSIAYYRYLDYINADVYRTTYYKNDGFSVRCLRD